MDIVAIKQHLENSSDLMAQKFRRHYLKHLGLKHMLSKGDTKASSSYKRLKKKLMREY